MYNIFWKILLRERKHKPLMSRKYFQIMSHITGLYLEYLKISQKSIKSLCY
jgi:hypothetical protein